MTFVKAGKRYLQDIFGTVNLTTVGYGANIDCTGRVIELKADLYDPANDTDEQKATIVILHGGGFEKGSRNEPGLKEMCFKLARKGYLVGSIDYRLGMAGTDPRNTVSALIRAVQDVNDFILFLKINAIRYKLDTRRIFLAGFSAGAITVLTKAFVKIDDTAKKLGIGSPEILEGKHQEPLVDTSVAAIYALWGGIFSTSWIQKDDIPVGLVHSIHDRVIPWNAGEGVCPLYGSYAIYKRAAEAGIPTTIYGYDSSRHNLGLQISPYKDITVTLMTDFFYRLMNTFEKTTHTER